MEIEDWRQKIDALDAKLLVLLNERAKCALAVGEIKRAAGQPIYAPDREMAILSRLGDRNPGPLSNAAVQRVFRQIIDESRRLEQERAERKEKTED